MPLPELFVESLGERDIDLVLLEELNASSDFRFWWLQQVHIPEPCAWEFMGVWHSVSHPTLGESDIVLLVRQLTHRHVVLVENKIDAPPQPSQAERYRLRGDAGIKDGSWDAFTTCIVAPAQYLDVRHREAGYDAAIDYEGIKAWFDSNHEKSSRSAYRARLLGQAIDQQRRGYTPKQHPLVTALWKGYWLTASSEFPELAMSEPGPKPAASEWIQFRPPSIAPNRRIIHKLTTGYVDLQLDGAAQQLDQLAQRYRNLLGNDISLLPTGKSVSLRMVVPVVDLFGEPGTQLDSMRAGMRAALQLLTLSRAIENT